MKLTHASIGYGGYSGDFAGPGDRRRFCAYAKIRGLSFEYADLKSDYDVVLITHDADVGGWTRRKREQGDKFKFIFELVDSYFVRTELPHRIAKGLARFVLGKDSRLSPDFLKTLIGACEVADAVICSTEEQRQTISRYNPSVFTTFDYFADDVLGAKRDYGRAEKLRIVWEGQSATLDNIAVVRDVLNDFRDRVELHVVSDPLSFRFFGRYFGYPSMRKLNGVECPIFFHPWRKESFSRDIVTGDLAIIPLNRASAFAWGKPENKLIMMWQMGIPTLATATPAYERVMRAANVDMLCRDSSDWRSQVERVLAASSADLERIGTKCRRFAANAYSREEFLRRFDRVFDAAGFDVQTG